MNYQQLVTPNLDPVVYQYGAALTDWFGWCLAVAWTAFSGHTTNPTAWSAWTNSVQYKHEDSDLPSGVYVPIWFSGYQGAGHVAICKDGQVWSSPYTHKATMDVLSSIAQVEKIYGVTYAGWSEDIGGVRVVQPVTEGETMVNRGDIINVYRAVLGHDPNDNDFAAWDGKEWNPFIYDLLGRADFLGGMKQNIANLQTQVDGLGKALAIKDSAIADLQAKLSTAQAVNGDATKWQTLGALLRELVGLNK